MDSKESWIHIIMLRRQSWKLLNPITKIHFWYLCKSSRFVWSFIQDVTKIHTAKRFQFYGDENVVVFQIECARLHKFNALFFTTELQKRFEQISSLFCYSSQLNDFYRKSGRLNGKKHRCTQRASIKKRKAKKKKQQQK